MQENWLEFIFSVCFNKHHKYSNFIGRYIFNLHLLHFHFKVIIQNLSHCVLLEHYDSVDFPWWFDKKKIRGFCHFAGMKFYLGILIISMEGKLMDGSFSKKHFIISRSDYISLMTIFCRTSCFHREWLLLIRIYMNFHFYLISKFEIVHILNKASH